MTTEKFSNLGTTTLNGDISSSVTTIIVFSASNLPSSGNFRILIDTEIMICTSISGTILTVTRGAESTVAAAHTSGSTVIHGLTVGAMDQMRIDNCGSDTYANIQAVEKAGRLYFPTDGFQLFRDNGSSWQAWGPVYPLTPPPLVSTLTWVNQSTATATDVSGGIYMSTPALAGGNIRELVQSSGIAPWTFTCGFLPNLYPLDNCNCGILCRESGTGALTRFIVFYANDATLHLFIGFYTGPTAGASTLLNITTNWAANGLCWLRINDNNTSRLYSISSDGQNWIQVYSETRTTNMTANQFGLCVESQQATGSAAMTVISYKVT